MEIQDVYQETLKFVATAHKGQELPGTELPYLIHIVNVCMEVMSVLYTDTKLDQELAIRCALLHDIIEDTEITYDFIKEKFGNEIANGVLALTKNSGIDSKDQLQDSLERIKNQPKEIWIIKMADRISNLQKPPNYWEKEKIIAYKKDAEQIYEMLKEANQSIANRLKQKIINYSAYI